MANLSITTEKIPVTVEKEVKIFNLALSKEEATLLYCILRKVGGSTAHSARKYSDSIYDALDSQFSRSDYNDQLISGSLYIKSSEDL